MKRFVLPCILIAGLVQCSFSQGEFLQRGQSNFGAGIGFSTNSEVQGWNFSAGYSYRAFLDANVSYSKANGGKVQGAVLTPRIAYYPLKQEDAQGAPTIALSLGYSAYTSRETNTYYVPDLGAATYHTFTTIEDQKINALLLGVTTQRRTGYWKVFFFQPVFGAELAVKNHGWDFALRCGVAIGTRIVQGPILILTPSLERRSGLTTLVFTLGAVL